MLPAVSSLVSDRSPFEKNIVATLNGAAVDELTPASKALEIQQESSNESRRRISRRRITES